MRKNNKVLALLIKNLPFLTPLFLSIVIWWNPNFLVPNTYFNLGDTLFPFRPELYLNISSHLWSNDGLGIPNYWPVFLPLACLVYILHLLKIPLWIINRLWLIIPTAMAGWCTYYLFRSLFKEKYSFICGLIAGIFAMFIPYQEIYAVIYFSFAGFPLILGSLIRGLDSDNFIRYSFLGALGILLTSLYPRYLYLSALIIFIYLLSHFLIQKNKVKGKTAEFLFTFSGTTLLTNAFWLFPTIISFSNTLLSSQQIYSLAPKGYDTGLMLLNQYKGWVNLLYVSRLFTSNPSHPLTHFMKIPIINLLSILMPVYAFSSFLFIKKRSFWILIPCVIFLFLFAIAPSYNAFYKIYLFFWQHLPGFFILKAPVFFISFLGIFYAILTGATTLGILNRIDSSQIIRRHFTKKTIKISLISILLILICFVYGGGLLIGYTPKENIWGHIIYGNHLPAAKIPEEYFELGRYLSQEENVQKGYRMFNLFRTLGWGGYARYNWWEYCGMPEMLVSLSTTPVIGVSFAPQSKLEEDLMNEINRKNFKGAAYLMKLLNIRYIVLHKDYLPIKIGDPLRKISQYPKHFAEAKNLEIIKDNQYFEVYKANAEDNEYFSTLTVIVGNIETLVPVTETKYLDGKPVIVFTEQMREAEKGIRRLGDWGRNFVFKDSSWQDLVIEITDAGYQIQDAGKERIEIEKPGVYEVYVDTSEFKEEIPEFEVRIDGKEIVWRDLGIGKLGTGDWRNWRLGRKYIKIWEVELGEGKHKIEVIGLLGYLGYREKIRLILVNKEEREKLEEEICEKIEKPETEVAYILSKDGEFWVK